MNGVLVDTSVWVQHFRQCNAALADLLVRDGVLMLKPRAINCM